MLLQKNSMVVNKYANSLLFRKAFTHLLPAQHTTMEAQQLFSVISVTCNCHHARLRT